MGQANGKDFMQAIEIHCECGVARITAGKFPITRMICHCTVCQRFTGDDYADILVYRICDLTGLESAPIKYGTMRPPPNVQRGKCELCATPFIDLLRIPVHGGWAMIPHKVHGTYRGLARSGCTHVLQPPGARLR